VYGVNGAATGLRPSFCVLARISASYCSASAVEASDWSIQPRTVTASLVVGQSSVSVLSGDQSWLADGDFVTGPGIPADTVITSGAGSSTWSLSAPATLPGNENLTASG
jgi:hypothetical protein